MLDRPLQMIIVGFILVLSGFVLPFLMLNQVIPSTFFLNFFAYSASVVGLFLGLIGSALYVRSKKRPK